MLVCSSCGDAISVSGCEAGVETLILLILQPKVDKVDQILIYQGLWSSSLQTGDYIGVHTGTHMSITTM